MSNPKPLLSKIYKMVYEGDKITYMIKYIDKIF